MEEEKRDNGFGRGLALGMLLSLAVLLALLGGVFMLLSARFSGVFSTGTLAKMLTIDSVIEKYALEDADQSDIADGIYKGMMSAIGDDYAEYYTKEEYQSMKESTEGSYDGIGALLTQDAETNEITIVQVYEGSPAEKAGLLAGDKLIAADEYRYVDLDLSTFVSHVKGKAGTTVNITYERDGKENIVEIERATVEVPSVEGQMLQDGIGYVQISSFDGVTPAQFESTMEDLKDQGMTSVIIDLRSNLGGLVDASVQMLDYILPEGTVVYTIDKNGKKVEYTSDAEHYLDMPIVVLVNGYTASAAEIFTGAIRDFSYGTIIGTQTYGKGIVQRTFPLSDGSALKLTVSKYYTPNGECIHKTGITPDIELEYEFLGGDDESYSIEYDNQVLRAIEELQK